MELLKTNKQNKNTKRPQECWWSEITSCGTQSVISALIDNMSLQFEIVSALVTDAALNLSENPQLRLGQHRSPWLKAVNLWSRVKPYCSWVPWLILSFLKDTSCCKISETLFVPVSVSVKYIFSPLWQRGICLIFLTFPPFLQFFFIIHLKKQWHFLKWNRLCIWFALWSHIPCQELMV